MKKVLTGLFFIGISILSFSQIKPFRFAFISDTHIGSPNGMAEEDLRRTVRDINAMNDIAFVVLTGDITELGTNEELKLARQILDSLRVKWFIIPGNHDTGWSESGGLMFSTVFGNDKFSFEYAGIRFLGCASGPYLRMSDGHVPRNAVNWLEDELKKINPGQPVIFLNHYPINEQLDNWYEITGRLHRVNTWAILCGHGHANKKMDFEGIPGVMGRSNLRAREPIGGYNLVDVRNDSILFFERNPGKGTRAGWTGVDVKKRNYDTSIPFPRPDFSINNRYPVKEMWRYHSPANIISTPAVSGDNLVVGNQDGTVICLSMKTGIKKWEYAAGGPVFSSPAVSGNSVVLGSADGSIHCINIKNGKKIWRLPVSAAVLGSPLVEGTHVYIGSSDSCFRKLDIPSGKLLWTFKELRGPVVSTPLLYEGNIIFGAWDRHLYALNARTGKLTWRWDNGSSIRNYSPAACIPVAQDGVIYVVAPDRFISAIDAVSGKTIWRNNDATVRESIGISADGKWIYGKTMQDTIVAYSASKEKQTAAWKMHVGFGYEHTPSMLIEKEGQVFFGTRSGVVYSIDPIERKTKWAYKIDNSMVNTVRVAGGSKLVAATMDGKIVLLDYR